MTVRQLILYFRTARYLKPSQLFYFMLRRLIRHRSVRIEHTPKLREYQWLEMPCPFAGIFYLRQRPQTDISRVWLDSLFIQARWLEKDDERHLLANH